METISIISVYIQMPLVVLLAWHCGRVRRRISGWINIALLAIIGCCAGMLAWRLSTLGLDLSFRTRVIGGTGFQTLFIAAIWVLVTAIGSLSDQKQK